MSKIFNTIKNFFWILVIIQVAPIIVKSIIKQYSSLLEAKTKVGLVEIKGVLTDSNKYVKDIKNLFENTEIKAIVLKIDSPGGAAGTAQNIFNEIKLLRSQYSNKFVISVVENIAGSGGYYIAASSNYIIASPAAFIGSIGAYIPHPSFKEFIENYKIRYEIIKAGEYKGCGSPFLDLTPAQKKMFQGLSDNVYNQFVKDVAQQRPNLPKDINLWANGQIFTGQQALELKLIDELGSQSTAIKVLKECAHIDGKIEWIKPPKNRSILYSLLYPEDDNDHELDMKSFVGSICQTIEDRYITKANC